MTLGVVALGLWRLATTLMTTENKEKAKGAVLGIVFLALGFSSLTFDRGSSSSDGQKSTSITSKILEMPGGKIIIVVGGLVIIGVGIYGIVKGATRKFVNDLEAGARAGKVGTGITVAGTAGYIACGIAFLVLGAWSYGQGSVPTLVRRQAWIQRFEPLVSNRLVQYFSF